jgi:hypothetical protein
LYEFPQAVVERIWFNAIDPPVLHWIGGRAHTLTPKKGETRKVRTNAIIQIGSEFTDQARLRLSHNLSIANTT